MTGIDTICQNTNGNNNLCVAGADAPAGGLPLRSYDEIKTRTAAKINWLWQGYLAAGDITLLTSQWKTGKTTLVSVLLSKLKDGGTLAGLPLQAGRAVIVSEEADRLWLQRGQKVEFGTHVRFLCRPFGGKPTLAAWETLMDQFIAERAQSGLDLVVIDSLATFLPALSENDAASMTQSLLPLGRLAGAGVAVLLLHHPRRKESAEGQLARGSGVLPGFVETLIEMHPVSRDRTDRRRRLQAFSRNEETPAHILIELNAAGNDYAALGNFETHSYTDSWQALERIFKHARDKLTAKEILDDWPEDSPKPSDVSLRKWLQQALDDNLVVRDGAGTKNKPYRFWTKEREKQWILDPFGADEMIAESPLGRGW